MIQALIFDCFGVLTTEGWLQFKDRHFAHDSELHQQATDLNMQSNLGLISHAEFVAEVAKLAGISAAQAAAAIDNYAPNEQLLAYIRQLKPPYKLGILSNASGNWLDSLFAPEDVALFDAAVLSYAVGAVKPDQRAYEIAAERLGVKLNECIFIDDQERYCTAAKEAGMQAVWYRNFEQMQRELEALLADTKR